MTGTISNSIPTVDQSYMYAYGTIASANIKTLNSIPVQLVAAPGANLMLIPFKITLRNTQGVNAYTGGGVLQLKYPSFTFANLTFNMTSTINPTIYYAYPVISTPQVDTNIVNQALYLSCASGDYAAGDADLQWDLTYSIFSTLT